MTQSEALKHWSDNPPTGDGFYWVCEPEYTEPEVVRKIGKWVYYGGSQAPTPRTCGDIVKWGPRVELPEIVQAMMNPDEWRDPEFIRELSQMEPKDMHVRIGETMKENP